MSSTEKTNRIKFRSAFQSPKTQVETENHIFALFGNTVELIRPEKLKLISKNIGDNWFLRG